MSFKKLQHREHSHQGLQVISPRVTLPTPPELLKQIVQLTIQTKLAKVFQCLRLKVINNLYCSFNSIRDSPEPHLECFKLEHSVSVRAKAVHQKLSHFFRLQKVKMASNFLQNIKQLFGGVKSENTQREMLRVNSKVERDAQQGWHSTKNGYRLLQDSKEQILGSQKVNKALRKKKEASDIQLNGFKQQMEQLLSLHQQYLSRRH